MSKFVIAGILLLNFTFASSQPFETQILKIDSLLENEQYDAAMPLIADASKMAKLPAEKNRLESRKYFAQWIKETQSGNEAAPKLLISAIQSLSKNKNADPDYQSVLFTQQYHYEAYKGNWGKSLEIALQLQHALEKNPPTKQRRTIDLVYDIGYIHDRLGNLQQSIEYYERSLALYESASKPYENDRALAHNNLASKYSQIDRFDKTIYHYTQAVAWWTKITLKDKSYLVTAYNNLVYYLLEYGDYQGAGQWIEALNKGFESWKREPDFGTKNTLGNANVIYKIRALHLIANLRYHAATAHSTLAQNYFDSLRMAYLNCPVDQRKTIQNHYLNAHYLMGSMYEKAKNTLTAKQFYEAGLALAENLEDGMNTMLMQSGIANLLNTTGQYETALQYTNASLTFFENQNKYSASHYSLLILKAMSMQNMGNHEQAVAFTEATLKQLMKEMNAANVDFDSLTIRNLLQINSRSVLRFTLNAAMVFRQASSALPDSRKEYTRKALHLYYLAADMFELYYQKSSYTPQLDQFQKEITDGLLSCITSLNNQDSKAITKAVETIINNSNQHLWRQFQAKYANRLTVPEALVEKQRKLKASLYLLQHPAQSDTIGNTSKQQLEKELANCEKEIAKYDQYFLQQSTHEFTIGNIRKLLQKQGILQYFVTDSAVYGIYIDRKALQLKKLGPASKLQNEVSKYRYQINTIDPNYQLAASTLYQSLIAPFAKIIEQKRLLIVPDRWLEMLPFEALYHQKAGKYLVQEYSIGYAGSLPLFALAMQMNHPNPMGLKLAIFAPEYTSENGIYNADNRAGASPLAFATAEANAIADAYPSTLFAKNEATKANFVKTSTKYKIMHFAMHATMDSMYFDSSALIFSNREIVPFADLYQMQLPLDLAVLSACNTGMGRYKPGEGLFGLSRAFTYAGTKSTIHSLWQVPDKETAGIITQLYASLMKGMSKDQALAQAKLAYLENATPPGKHPYYWAGFAVSGSMEPIDKKSGALVFIFLAVAIAGISYLGWKSYNRRLSLVSKADA